MNYVGIDLGTTNSAVCSYDGETVRLYKSPGQHDVTPSAIYFDPRGNKYLGDRAYNNAARDPASAATVFKRLIGTTSPIKIASTGKTMTPEECSGEILRLMFGYLPEDIRNDPETGTVITVPAAFNLMQKDATLSAAEAAGIGRVALMQEPVAAVMSVMQKRKNDGTFLVYDLGGGTLDIAIAQSISGRVSLLAHGGISMCGGRDFDRVLFDNVVKPWLLQTFDLPDDLSAHPQYQKLVRMAGWATEKAKIELSQSEEAHISLAEGELGVRDRAGVEIFVDVAVTRAGYDALIAPRLAESIEATRETLESAGLSPQDVERVVFVGGPTQYKPLRDKVAFELGIAASTDVNPMTAVAEGAAVFAESIDWASANKGRKSARGLLNAGGPLEISFGFTSRTPDTRARILAKVSGKVAAGTEWQLDSLDTGWSSGRVPLKNEASLDLILAKPGANTFKVFVFDATGGPLALPDDKIVITRTAATVDAIPASHSVAVQVQDRAGGRTVPYYLVRKGDQLPKSGKATFRAGESLRAGSAGSLKFKLWEGDIPDPVDDNRHLGTLEIKGTSFADAAIAAGAELFCTYTVRDSGNIWMEVSIPSIGGSFDSGHNFYSRQEGGVDYTTASLQIEEEAAALQTRLEEMESKVTDPKLEEARARIEGAGSLRRGETDPETAKRAMDDVQEAKRLLSIARQRHLPEIRQGELDKAVALFNTAVREHARPSETSSFDNLSKTAQRAINQRTDDFESHLGELYSKSVHILWRQDWFVIDRFKRLADSPHQFADRHEHAQMVAAGNEALKASDMDKLRATVGLMDRARIGTTSDDQMFARANIVLG